MIVIRDAAPADIGAITEITNALIATTTYEWTSTPHTPADVDCIPSQGSMPMP